ncbi:MAG: hypothetical protein A2234_07355 [Elusimicrobia bacterium RIFOXYA2_FULL_58_8]|nr:MAG: hypothetical protein A2234_07355 [Elusimicrobia bacterium RIFOXYA2_FULL_58_8]OGS13689.1 MAG: hypothetical protein A2285_01125 [Elusimicrobia bacterium RIFOXYA12_FULL_57_11]
MKIFILFFLTAVQLVSAATPKYSAVNGATATTLSADNTYFRNPENTAYDYWALSPFYVPQHNGYACSAASVAMALNALLNAGRERGDEEENISPQSLPDKVKGFDWKGLVSEKGSAKRHGVTLLQLAQAAREALESYSPGNWEVSITTASTQTPQALQSFREALESNERVRKDIMLLHFAQDIITGAPGGPYAHTSPVGAYDKDKRRILILDVDRQWYEPYWADDTQVLNAMAVSTKSFGHGGYIILKSK